MAGQVEGKVALVTGGASGIGEAIVELLAQEGATVVATDIDELRGPELAARLSKAGRKVSFLPQDVTSEERWIEVVAEIGKRHGRLDIMVANAGIGISLGDDCVVEAGCYVTAGTKVVLTAPVAEALGKEPGTEIKALELSGANGLQFRRNSVSGSVEAVPAKGIELNEALHAN